VASKARIGDKDLPWHHDIPWHREKRYPIRSLYPTRLEATKGTTTNFCDADSIWQRIPKEQWEELAQADIRIQFWYDASKGAENPPTKIVPLVERHPHTGRHSLLLNSFGPKHEQLPFSTSYTGAWILDCWSKRKRLGLKYLNHLHEKVCTPDNIYEHEWELGDLVLFDNYSGVFHGRDRIVEAHTIREFWRMNLRHYWQTKESA
jgi:alpha-ketoglutarate-dependent taurine dioxygenase